MGSRPLVSVVIPCYNSESTVGETLQSVRRQTWPDWEAIVVNDGSTDASTAIIRRQAAEDRRIRYVEQRNQGLAAARNAGLQRAGGEFVNFLDADDLLLPEMLARTAGRCQFDDSLAGACCGTALADARLTDASWHVTPQLDDPLFPQLAKENPFACHSVVLRRSLVVRAGAFDGSLQHCHDWDLWQRVARLGARLLRVPTPLVIYRMMPASMSRNAASFFAAGKQVILRGHGRDPRVAQPIAEFAEGCRTCPARAVARWAITTGSIAVAQGNVDQACALWEAACSASTGPPDSSDLAAARMALHYGAAVTPARSDALWRQVGRPLLETLLALESRLDRPGLAVQWLIELLGYPAQLARHEAELEALRRSPTRRLAASARRWLHRLARRAAPA